MDIDKEFIPLTANYDKLTAYQKGECIYDITYYFAHKYLAKGDRTVDQMIQAARSGICVCDHLRCGISTATRVGNADVPAWSITIRLIIAKP